MRVTNIILTLLFGLFAIFQFNDVDPWIWITLYGFVAVVSGFAIFGRYNVPIIIIGMVISLIGLGILLPEIINWINLGMPNIAGSMKAETAYVEFTREFFGLVIVLSAFLYHFRSARRLRKSA